MLFFRRAVNRKYSFRLATEMSAVAGFDDVVFQYEQNGTTVYMLIQVKHKEDNSKKICVGNFLTKSGELDLVKHFAAFLKIQDDKELKGKIKDFFFVTNADFNYDNLAKRGITVEKMGTQDDFLNIGESARYKLIDSGGNVTQYLDQWMRDEGREVSDKEIENFLSKLVFAVNLPNDAKLEELIKDEISDNLARRFRYYDENNIVFNDLFVKMSSWTRNKKGYFLTPKEGEEFFQEVEEWANTFGEIALGVERIKEKVDEIREEVKILANNRQVHSNKEPICFNVKHPVKTFVGRKGELKAIHDAFQGSADKKAEVSQVVVISGLGGVGKTELARKYGRSKEKYYDGNIIWIDAEKQEDLEESFQGLARELNRKLSKDKQIPLTIERVGRQEEREITCIIKDIYECFGYVKSLFIFDNAEKYGSISKFLPLALSSQYNKPCILITSHDRKFDAREEGNIEVILLDEFDEIEALEFVKGALNIQDNLQNKEIEELTEELQHFPLALGQAVAYILNKNKELSPRRKFVISDYLKEYRQEAEKLFKEIEKLLENEKKECESAVRYTKTVLTTWNITRNRIADNNEYGKQAIDVFNIMAYLAPDNINIEEIFAKPIADNEQRLWDAVKLLDRYSMINLREKVVNIHRLVQKVTRLKLREEGQEKAILRKALELMNNNIAKEDISHIVSVWEYASEYGKLIDDFYFNSFYTHKESFFIKKSTPLHLLAKSGTYEAIETILTHVEKHNSDRLREVINIQEEDCALTPLHIAAGGGRLSVVRCLVNKGADIHAGVGGYTSLYLAARLGELSIVRYLNRQGADINSKNIFGGTALHVAAYRGKLNVVRYLISKGADINTNSVEPFFNGTPLHCAVHSERPNIVKCLLDRGADVSIEDEEGKTPLYRAAGGENLNIVKCLVEKGADICAKSQKGMIPLYAAAKCGSVSIMRYFIGRGININFRDEYGNTMLHLAAGNHNLNAVEYLIKKGAHINARNKNYSIPLHFAAVHDEVVEYLIYEGAYINAKNKDGNIALHIAAMKGNASAAQVLLEYSTELIFPPKAKNDDGWQYSADGKELCIVQRFIRKSASVNFRNKDGNTPLHLAAMKGKVAVAKVLLKYNADINTKNNEGMIALHYATDGNHQKLVKLLLAHNANPIFESA